MKVKPLQIAVFAGYAALGPITGPLTAGLVRNIRRGEKVLAALYAIAIPVSYCGLVSAAGLLLPLSKSLSG
jgi:hypothetical protein